MEHMDHFASNTGHIQIELPPDTPAITTYSESDGLLKPQLEHRVQTNIPLRLDRLPFSTYHFFIVMALGVSWILDGLIVSSLGLIGSRLQDPDVFGLSTTEVGVIGTVYISGAITGALIFGILADRFGRKRLFIITPLIYIIATQAAAWSFRAWLFIFTIFFVGLGIGGEYSAMNSAINELIPAKVRGMIDLAINGSYWFGALIGAALTVLFLDPKLFDVNVGWRYPFALASLLGLGVCIMRFFLPESPRWLILHNRIDEAEQLITAIEARVEASTKKPLEPVEQVISVKLASSTSVFRSIVSMFTTYKRRAFLALSLMVSQAFFYNAIFFTYALILHEFYGVPSDDIGLYEMPFCVGNFLGSLCLGPLFDVIGRKPMIASTYTTSAMLLGLTGYLFVAEKLTAVTQTICWAVIFFVSSASSSSAYLTISEIFPLEIRALSIAIFYACGTGIGGIIGPSLFGALLENKDRVHLVIGYGIGCALMVFAAMVELVFGIKAEGKSLEMIQEENENGAQES